MTTKQSLRVGILLQQGFQDKFEAQALLNTFKSYEWQVDLIILNDVFLDINKQHPAIYFKNKNLLTDYDVILIREVFSRMKLAILISRILKANNITVIDNNLATEQFVANKIREGLTLINAGLPFPKTFYATTIDAYLNNLDKIINGLGFPMIIKHNSMGKGARIYKVDNKQQLLAKLDELHNLDIKKAIRRYHIQEFLQLKADYRILVIGNKVIGAMQRIPKEGEFRANFSLGGQVKPAQLTQEMKTLAEQAINATNANFAGVDIVYTEDNKPYILEVNRTPGFKGFMTAYNINIPNEFIRFIEKEFTKKIEKNT